MTNAFRELLPDRYRNFLTLFNEQQVERNKALGQGIDPLTEIGPPPLRLARERWQWDYGERRWLIDLKQDSPSLVRRPTASERLAGSKSVIYRELALAEIFRITVSTMAS